MGYYLLDCFYVNCFVLYLFMQCMFGMVNDVVCQLVVGGIDIVVMCFMYDGCKVVFYQDFGEMVDVVVGVVVIWCVWEWVLWDQVDFVWCIFQQCCQFMGVFGVVVDVIQYYVFDGYLVLVGVGF